MIDSNVFGVLPHWFVTSSASVESELSNDVQMSMVVAWTVSVVVFSSSTVASVEPVTSDKALSVVVSSVYSVEVMTTIDSSLLLVIPSMAAMLELSVLSEVTVENTSVVSLSPANVEVPLDTEASTLLSVTVDWLLSVVFSSVVDISLAESVVIATDVSKKNILIQIESGVLKAV